MKIPDLKLENLKEHMLGRMRLHLFNKITQVENTFPTKDQTIAYLESVEKNNFSAAELFNHIITSNDYFKLSNEEIASVQNISELLESLDSHPLSEPVLFEILNFAQRAIGAWIKTDKLDDKSGYFYTVMLLEEDPQKVIFYCQIRSSQKNPEPSAIFYDKNGQLLKIDKRELQSTENVFLKFCLNLLNHANKNQTIFIDLENASELHPEELSFHLDLPQDKQLSFLLEQLVKGKGFCFETEIDISQITPYSYDHFFKIPIYIINQAERYVEDISERGLLLYQKGKEFIMSDDYTSYFVLKKAGYTRVKAIIVGKTFPKGLKLIRRGGKEMLPGLLRLKTTSYNGLSKGLKDQVLQKYIDRLNFLESSKKLLDSEYIIFTEDQDIAMLKVLLQSNGFNVDELEIYSYKSSANFNSIDLIVNTFKLINKKIKIIFHRDRDYLAQSEVEKIKSKIIDAQANPFITRGTDIESYFINEKHIWRLYPEISLNRIEELISQATTETKVISIDGIKKYEHGEKYGKKDSHFHDYIESMYETNKERFRHGKKTLGVLTGLLQKEIKRNINLYQPSEFLIYEEIKSLL